MKNCGLGKILSIIAFALAAISICAPQSASQGAPIYLDPSKPLGARLNDLISRMTREETTSQLVNQSRAIPRLQVLLSVHATLSIQRGTETA